MQRPMPPRDLIENPLPDFSPDPYLDEWVRATFIDEGATLKNDDHEHLQSARIGYLWTNIENVRRGRMILGTCQLLPPNGDPWTSGRSAYQIESWFGYMPDFLITIHSTAAITMENAAFMAIVEHELYHAAQKKDDFGMPKFSKETGRPIWAIRPHDVEEFVGVVARYGADACKVRDMVTAANKGPLIADARIDRACGTCLRLVK